MRFLKIWLNVLLVQGVLFASLFLLIHHYSKYNNILAGLISFMAIYILCVLYLWKRFPESKQPKQTNQNIIPYIAYGGWNVLAITIIYFVLRYYLKVRDVYISIAIFTALFILTTSFPLFYIRPLNGTQSSDSGSN